MPRRGLPTSMAMRHDEHYVDALAASAGTPVGRLIPIEHQHHAKAVGGAFPLAAPVAEAGVGMGGVDSRNPPERGRVEERASIHLAQ